MGKMPLRQTLLWQCLFDCMNVCNFTDGKQSRNAFKAPYRSVSDFRVEVSIHVYILNHYV